MKHRMRTTPREGSRRRVSPLEQRRRPAAWPLLTAAVALLAAPFAAFAQEAPLRVFISVDMEGISGVGTGAMTSSGGKDYATARRLMTDEVNAVVEA
ncbi:MAG: M55 family metallopeptidase, partial [Longimicrobiales bacterium]|nr:M55 family metallopeptidase [Longimicrobiales bacterium]